jgi:hypothetical protein
VATGPMDDGKLVPSWFGEGLEFREASEVDYLWVKEGLVLDGRTLHFVEWPDPEFIGEVASKRDDNDHRLARMIGSDMAATFRDAFQRHLGGTLQTSLSEGDVTVEGRIVDCSTGSTAAKMLVGFGAGSGNTTIDLKLTDAATGELLVGLHHRVVSGTTWSTTDSKFVNWIGDLAEEVAKKGFVTLYAKGKPKNK